MDVHLALPNFRNVFKTSGHHMRDIDMESCQVQRIMTDSLVRFDPGDTARHTIKLYGRALDRSLVHLKAAANLPGPSQMAA